MSALAKNTSSKSSSKKSTSSKSTSKDNGASPKNAKGKTTVKAKAKFAGSLATAVKPTPPHQPTKPKQAPKPKKKDQGVPESPVMGQAAASPEGACAAAAGPGATGAKQGAGKGAKSETSKAAKKVNTQKPSKIIKAYKGLGKNVTASKKKDEAEAHDAIPDYHAVMPGDAAMEAEGKKQNPKADTKVDDKVPGAEGKAPKIEKQKKGKSKRQKVDSKSAAELKRLAAIENALDAMKSMLASMTAGISTDSNVNTDPGPAPEIVFSGSSNPQRAEKADAEADTKINEGHEKFVKAIDDGKQPSDVKRQEMDEVVKAVKQSDLKIGEEQLAAGEKYYEKLIKEHTTKEIDNADGILDPDIQGQMAKANKDMDQSLEKQETDRQAALDKARADIDSQNQKAKDEQESIVDKAKKDIAKQQKDTRKKQDEEVKKAKKKGDREKKQVEKDIADKEQKDEKKIEGEYTKAEKKAEAEEKKAEKKAQAKKREAEKKKKEQSWWERAKSAVSSFVDSVCSMIGDIFDALSSLVSGILNAVKDLACAIIDEAIKWAKKALDGLGSLLKGLVNGLIGDIFPGLAKALNEGIDAGIDLAKKGVDTVGEKLKEGVTAAIDTVNATVQKGLQVAKVGLQTAVRVTGCIATGDFEGAFLATFYGALEIAGVSRSDADKMLGDAKETIKLIVDDFGGFAGNLISAAGDGFANFGKNFLSHFTGAVTDWLLGPVAAAGLKAPEKWDAQGIFGMVLGVLGVSTDSLKEMATERIGEDNMAALEKAFEYVTAFIDGGFAGLWEQAKSDLGNIWDLVLGMITDYITQKVVQFGMEQLASLMAGPFGALYQALKTAWGIYQTVRDKISEIKEVLTAIFSSVSDIARGNTKKASDWVENALAKVLGIAIDLGANLAGIGDIPDKIRGFVEGLQERVKTAIGKAMDWVLEKVKGLFAGGKDEKKDDAAKDDKAPEPARTLPGDQPIAWQGGLITLTWSQEKSIVLNVEGKYAGHSSKSIDAMTADVKKTPDTPERKKALGQLKAAKGLVAVAHSKAGKWIQSGEGSKEDLAKRTGDIAGLILDGLVPLDRIADASKQKGPDQANTHKVGEVVHFQAAGEKHRVFIDVNGKDADVMVASRIKKARDHLTDFQSTVMGSGFKGDKNECGQLIKKGRQLAGVTDKAADAALGGTGAPSAVVAEQKSLGDVFKKLFEMTASDADKKVHVILSKKAGTPDADHLATFLLNRTDGISENQAKAWSRKKVLEDGRKEWRGSLSSDKKFFVDVAATINDTIATRKIKEFAKEHQGDAIAKFGEFWTKLIKEWAKSTHTGKDAVYTAMMTPAGDYLGLGQSEALDAWDTMYRVVSAADLYKHSVDKGIKDRIATKLRVATYDDKDLDSPVFAQWAKDAGSGGAKISSRLFDSGGRVSWEKKGWWSPDDRYVKPAATDGIQGNKDFQDFCEVGALAPEWYPAGFVNCHMDTSKLSLVRPTVFDGMMSPLWVQQPKNEYAATGGGAIELISLNYVKLGDCKALFAHIVAPDVRKALERQNAKNHELGNAGKENITNATTEDTSAIKGGKTPAEKKVAEMQGSVADKTAAERGRANNENLLTHLREEEGLAKNISSELESALKKAPAPPKRTRMPSTLDYVFKARPSLKGLFYKSSAEGTKLHEELMDIEVQVTFSGGTTRKRTFTPEYYTMVRAAMGNELKGTVRNPQLLEKGGVLRTPKSSLLPKSKSRLETWLKKQKGGTFTANPQFEADAKKFEKKLGKLAEKHDKSLGAGKKMCKKAWDYLQAYETLSTSFSDLDKSMLELLAECGTELKEKWAGRRGKVGLHLIAIRDLFAGGGSNNIRDMFTHVNNFCENVLGSDMLNKSTKTAEALIKQAGLNKTAIRKRRADLNKSMGIKRDSTGTPIGAQVKGSKINDDPKGDQAIVNKGETRIEKDMGNAWSRTKKDESSDQLSLTGFEQNRLNNNPLGSEFLPWVEGAEVWDINEENAWVKQARALSMPLAGGVSGTTNRMMQNSVLLKSGVPKSHVRLAAMGYLIPIKAHSFHEIMVSARANGVPYTDGEYSPISPLSASELDKIGPVPER